MLVGMVLNDHNWEEVGLLVSPACCLLPINPGDSIILAESTEVPMVMETRLTACTQCFALLKN